MPINLLGVPNLKSEREGNTAAPQGICQGKEALTTEGVPGKKVAQTGFLNKFRLYPLRDGRTKKRTTGYRGSHGGNELTRKKN